MATIFPTQYSLLSATALKDHVEQRYGFRDLTGTLLTHNVSDTYLMASPTEQYVFKVYRRTHRSLDEIIGEVELLTVLHQQGAKVSYALSDLTGNYVQEFTAAEGIRHGVLFTFAPGKPVYDLTDGQLTVVGREMAFMHTITSRIELQHDRKPYTIETTITEPLKTLKTAFADDPDSYAYLLNTADRIIKKLESIDTTAFGYGYCHYDLLPKNFHFDQTNSVTFFDFDFTGKGFLAHDLLTFSLHFFYHASAGKLTWDEADRAFDVFLAGYRAVRPISDEEVAAIPYLGFMFWTFYLNFQYENFEEWSNFFFTPRYLKDFVDNRVRQYVERYCQF